MLKMFKKYQESESNLLDEKLMYMGIYPYLLIAKMLCVAFFVFVMVVMIYHTYILGFNFDNFKNNILVLLSYILIYLSCLKFSNSFLYMSLLPKIYIYTKIKDRIFSGRIESFFDIENKNVKKVLKDMDAKITEQKELFGGYTGSLLMEIQESVIKQEYFDNSNNIVQII